MGGKDERKEESRTQQLKQNGRVGRVKGTKLVRRKSVCDFGGETAKTANFVGAARARIGLKIRPAAFCRAAAGRIENFATKAEEELHHKLGIEGNEQRKLKSDGKRQRKKAAKLRGINRGRLPQI